jgi:hypothetical protein
MERTAVVLGHLRMCGEPVVVRYLLVYGGDDCYRTVVELGRVAYFLKKLK